MHVAFFKGTISVTRIWYKVLDISWLFQNKGFRLNLKEFLQRLHRFFPWLIIISDSSSKITSDVDKISQYIRSHTQTKCTYVDVPPASIISSIRVLPEVTITWVYITRYKRSKFTAGLLPHNRLMHKSIGKVIRHWSSGIHATYAAHTQNCFKTFHYLRHVCFMNRRFFWYTSKT